MYNGQYLYTKYNNIYFIKFIGNIIYPISNDLNKFLDCIFMHKDFENIVVDLTQTEQIDSTNIGLLAKIAKFMFDNFNKKTTLISTNENITQLLVNMGLNKIFIIIDKPFDLDANLKTIPHIKKTDKQMARTMIEAHSNLIKLNQKNRKLFENVVECLKREVGTKEP